MYVQDVAQLAHLHAVVVVDVLVVVDAHYSAEGLVLIFVLLLAEHSVVVIAEPNVARDAHQLVLVVAVVVTHVMDVLDVVVVVKVATLNVVVVADATVVVVVADVAKVVIVRVIQTVLTLVKGLVVQDVMARQRKLLNT